MTQDSDVMQPASCQATGCTLPPSALPWALHVLVGSFLQDAVVLQLRLCQEHGGLLEQVIVEIPDESAGDDEDADELDEFLDDDEAEEPPDGGGEAA